MLVDPISVLADLLTTLWLTGFGSFDGLLKETEAVHRDSDPVTITAEMKRNLLRLDGFIIFSSVLKQNWHQVFLVPVVDFAESGMFQPDPISSSCYGWITGSPSLVRVATIEVNAIPLLARFAGICATIPVVAA